MDKLEEGRMKVWYVNESRVVHTDLACPSLHRSNRYSPIQDTEAVNLLDDALSLVRILYGGNPQARSICRLCLKRGKK